MDQEIIKSVASSSVLGKAYDDLVHPSAKSLGNTISLVPRSHRPTSLCPLFSSLPTATTALI